MIYNLKAIRKQFLGLPLSEADFKDRGFKEGYEAQPRLELVAKTVVQGYNTAVEHGLGPDLEAIIAGMDQELVGFFHEGVGMGLYALDLFSLTNKDRFWKFIEGVGSHHEYMSYIGAGLTCAVFNRSYDKLLDRASTTGWLALDGIGFYYAMFKTKKALSDFYVPKSILKKDSFYLNRYDNGVGRAVWFYCAGEPTRIAQTISTFAPNRQGPIWSGIGLAATYANGVGEEKLRKLRQLSGEHVLQLGQGSVMASHTRYTAGNPSDATKMSSMALVGRSAEECHQIAKKYKDQLQDKKFINGVPAFQIFLDNLQEWLASVNKKTLLAAS